MSLSVENNPIYPWQISQWRQVLRLKQQKRLPHALLFAGIAGIGKLAFAEQFCQSLFCNQNSENGFCCQNCHDNHLITQKTHPNIRWVEPDENNTIKIDQIREVTEFVYQTSLRGEYKIVLFNPAESLTLQAANALLKTLEEPSSNSLMILLSHQPSRLMATILSRCQKIIFSRPDKEQAINFLTTTLTSQLHNAEILLQLAHGAPLLAVNFVKDDIFSVRTKLYDFLSANSAEPTQLASQLSEFEMMYLFNFILMWMKDIVRLQLDDDKENIINKDYGAQLITLQAQTNLKMNIQFIEYVQQTAMQIYMGINLNKQLMLENLLIRYQQCFLKRG